MAISSLSIQSGAGVTSVAVTGNVTVEVPNGVGLHLIAAADPGTINVFIWGPGITTNRVGSDWTPPYDIVLPDLTVGATYTVKVEQYKKTGSTTVPFTLKVVEAPREKMRIGAYGLDKVAYDTVKPAIAEFGFDHSRSWNDPGSFNTYQSTNRSRLVTLSSAGVLPILVVAQDKLNPASCTPDRIKAWGTAFATELTTQFGSNPVAVELGNEANVADSSGHGRYYDFAGSEFDRTRDYLQRVQVPLYAAIKAVNPKILCLSMALTWNAAVLESTADLAMSCSDLFAFHPYPVGTSTVNMERIYQAAETAHKRKRAIAFTEAQFHYGKTVGMTDTRWCQDLKSLVVNCRKAAVDMFCYFPFFDEGTTNSKAALYIKKPYAPRSYAAAFKSALATPI